MPMNPLNLCFYKQKSPPPSPHDHYYCSQHASKTKASLQHLTQDFDSSQNTLLFNSLYDAPTTPICLQYSTSPPSSSPAVSPSSSSSPTRPSTETDNPDLSSVLSSSRFFMPSPGHSNAVVEEDPTFVGPGCFVVPTYSRDPYKDFRLSMEEIAAAHGVNDSEGLHELLLIYLAFNRKCNHHFILRAFTDLLSTFAHHRWRQQSENAPTHWLESSKNSN